MQHEQHAPAREAVGTVGSGRPRGRDFWSGFKLATPLWLSVYPVGMTFGATAGEAGLSQLETVAMAAFVFTGTAQLATVTLLKQQAGLVVIVATSILVNLRYIPMAASLAPPLSREPWQHRVLGALALTDESYASSFGQLRTREAGVSWLFGAGASIYIAWVSSSMVGLFASRAVSIVSILSLAIVFPLFCATIVARASRGLATWAACATGAAAVILAALWLHPGVALLLGILAGGAVSYVWRPAS